MTDIDINRSRIIEARYAKVKASEVRRSGTFRISLGSMSAVGVRYVFRRNTGFRSTIGRAGTRNGQWIEQNQLNCALFPFAGLSLQWDVGQGAGAYVRPIRGATTAVEPREIVLTIYVPSRRFAK